MFSLQTDLFAAGEIAVRPDAPSRRLMLDPAAWVETAPGWLAGADSLLAELIETVPWRQGRRQMYDRMVDDPRLSRWYASGENLPHPALAEIRAALAERYRVPFGAVGLNYYRDGRDSVAFHRDRELRYLDDTLVAIVTLGAARPFLIRPHVDPARRAAGRSGGSDGGTAKRAGTVFSQRFRPASGDLLVMGGGCQARWEHAVPKGSCSGARISISVRWSAGRGEETNVRRRGGWRRRS